MIAYRSGVLYFHRLGFVTQDQIGSSDSTESVDVAKFDILRAGKIKSIRREGC